MVFNSIVFAIFIAIFFPLYWILKGRQRMWLCFLGSYLFYGWWDWRFLGIVMFTTILDFSLGIFIENEENPEKKSRLVLLSVISNLGFLGFFKYFNFFAASLISGLDNLGVHSDWKSLNIILPIGISFYTFQSMSYTIDVYRKEIKPSVIFGVTQLLCLFFRNWSRDLLLGRGYFYRNFKTATVGLSGLDLLKA